MASIANRQINFLKLSLLLITGLVFVGVPVARAYAQSQSDLQSIYDDTTFYDPFSSTCPDQTSNTLTAGNPASVSGNRVFYIGDSLTYHMTARGGDLLTKTATAGYSVDPGFLETDRD